MLFDLGFFYNYSISPFFLCRFNFSNGRANFISIGLALLFYEIFIFLFVLLNSFFMLSRNAVGSTTLAVFLSRELFVPFIAFSCAFLRSSITF